jgi:hypothetical protein
MAARHDSHRPKVHHADNEQDGYQTGTALAAVEAEAEAVPPSRGGVRRQRTAASRRFSATGEVMRLPCRELERSSEKDDHAGRRRNRARQRRVLHLDRRQRDAQRKNGNSEHRPDEEVTGTHERGEPTKVRHT